MIVVLLAYDLQFVQEASQQVHICLQACICLIIGVQGMLMAKTTVMKRTKLKS